MNQQYLKKASFLKICDIFILIFNEVVHLAQQS
jgi:hypothetical protein